MKISQAVSRPLPLSQVTFCVLMVRKYFSGLGCERPPNDSFLRVVGLRKRIPDSLFGLRLAGYLGCYVLSSLLLFLVLL